MAVKATSSPDRPEPSSIGRKTSTTATKAATSSVTRGRVVAMKLIRPRAFPRHRRRRRRSERRLRCSPLTPLVCSRKDATPNRIPSVDGRLPPWTSLKASELCLTNRSKRKIRRFASQPAQSKTRFSLSFTITKLNENCNANRIRTYLFFVISTNTFSLARLTIVAVFAVLIIYTFVL